MIQRSSGVDDIIWCHTHHAEDFRHLNGPFLIHYDWLWQTLRISSLTFVKIYLYIDGIISCSLVFRILFLALTIKTFCLLCVQLEYWISKIINLGMLTKLSIYLSKRSLSIQIYMYTEVKLLTNQNVEWHKVHSLLLKCIAENLESTETKIRYLSKYAKLHVRVLLNILSIVWMFEILCTVTFM